MRSLRLLLVPALAAFPLFGEAQYATTVPSAAVKGWPAEVVAVKYLSAADHTMQPTLFYKPPGAQPVPLLVALHTWSYDYKQPEPAYAKWCIAKGWVLLHPNFRGPNNNPKACGSDLVVQDILSAVDFARQQRAIDPARIYLVGVSGGGYLSMLLAGRHPEIWAAVSEWCGLFDLKDWYAQAQARHLVYAAMAARACGGAPGSSPQADEQYRVRSASAYLANAKGLPMDLNTGIRDGHKTGVPNSQTLRAFNALAAPADQLGDAEIDAITRDSKIPADLQPTAPDPVYARGKVLARRISGNARVTVFDGGHAIIYEAALAWLEQQRKGQPPVWNIQPATGVDLNDQSISAGK